MQDTLMYYNLSVKNHILDLVKEGFPVNTQFQTPDPTILLNTPAFQTCI